MKNYKYILEAINRGISMALDDFEEQQNDFIAPKKEVIRNNNSVKDLIDFHKTYIDLGLPSGTLWRKYNLGCDLNKLLDGKYKTSKPEDWYGNYYAWGELKPKDEYSWETYKFSAPNDKLTKYTLKDSLSDTGIADDIDRLTFEDDAAYQYDNRLRMPTKEQFRELISNTEPSYIEDFLGVKGLNGFAMCAPNHKHIFIPLAGCYGVQNNSQLQGLGSEAYLWSSDVANGHRGAFRLNLVGRGFANYDSTRARCDGLPIRPVLNKI